METTTLTGSDGVSLFCRIWLPAAPPRAVLTIVHGLGEHSGRYQHVADFLVARGFAVFAVDLRGHGKSGGKRGHINHFQDYVNDARTLMAHARQQVPAVPIFLLGHSMGGLTALLFALKHPPELAGVIASGPGLRTRLHIPVWKAALGKVMSNLWPTLSMPNGIDPHDLCHDPAVVAAYIADPLVHNNVTTRWYAEFTAAGEWALAQASTLRVPALILQGGADPIIDPAGARQFFERITLDDKRHIEYPGLYHEILNEPEQLTVLNDIETWLKPRI